MIVDYYIAVSSEGGDIEPAVKKMIAEGWQPLGAPFIWEPSFIAQAMIKEEKHED